MKIPGYNFELLSLNDEDLKEFEEPIGLSSDSEVDGYLICVDGDDGSIMKIPFNEIREFGRDDDQESPNDPEYYIKVDTTEGQETYQILSFIVLAK